MVVYGKRKTKYILSTKPVNGDGEGAVYPVSGRDDILVKIYQKSMRTTEKEYQVMEAISGTGTMLGEFPLDIVYERGKFAGYIFEKEDQYISPVETPVEVHKNTGIQLNSTIAILISIIFGLLLSIAIYFSVFPYLERYIQNENLIYYLNGIPMIIGGWIIMIPVSLKIKDMGIVSVVFSIVAFAAGSGILFGLNWLLVTLIKIVVAIVWAIFPTIFAIALVIWIVKYVFK